MVSADRRHVGQFRHALGLHDRERAQLPSLTSGHSVDTLLNELALAGDQAERRGAGAFVGHVHQLDAGCLREQLRLEMAEIADAGAGVIKSAGLLLGERDQLGDVLTGNDGCTASSEGRRITDVTWMKSFIGL